MRLLTSSAVWWRQARKARNGTTLDGNRRRNAWPTRWWPRSAECRADMTSRIWLELWLYAAQVVQPEGRIILMTQAAPALDPGAEVLRKAETPEQGLSFLRRQNQPGFEAAVQWARAAQRAHIYLLSGWPDEQAEELFVTPMEHAGQLQRLLHSEGSYLILEDADKALPVAQEAFDE